ncbi:hypothetical protein [Aliidiomarina indica]|uniref:hypothetical protein n=1 Tax=Aliidiomarina indica TaxID=2749147 RepID=UPI0018903320|nr:hypothetical protein [Aliidiomarina indica]
MSLAITKRSGFILRLLTICAFTCMMLFTAIVIVQNEELGKLVPPSTIRTLALMFGYIVALCTFNYAMAIKGRNFMGWQNELFIMLGFVIVFIAMFLPHAFPTNEVTRVDSWVPFMSKETFVLKANWKFAYILFLAVPFFMVAWKRIKELDLWKAKR